MPTLDRALALRLRGMGTREGPDGGLLVLIATVDRGFGGFGGFDTQDSAGGSHAERLVPDRLPAIAAQLELALTGPHTFQGTAAIRVGATRAIRLTTMGAGLPGAGSGPVAHRRGRVERTYRGGGVAAIAGMVASLITIGAATAGRFGHEIWLLFPGSLAGIFARDF